MGRRMTDSELMQLSEQVGQALKARGATVTTAESCTGGWVAKTLTDIAGSSAWFERGFVTYSNEAKSQMIGVSAEKPVGTVWFGVASASGQGVTQRECFAGDREAVRRQATAYALNLLWQQFLQNT